MEGFIIPSKENRNVCSWLVLILTLLCTVRWSEGQQGDIINLHYEVMEEAREGTLIANVFQDSELADSNSAATVAALTFRFLKDPEWDFRIDGKSGIITTGARLDRDTLCDSEPRCETTLDVVALAGSPRRLVKIIKVTVEIMDLNDNSPRFPEPSVTFELLESASVGTRLPLRRAIDPDAGKHGVQDYRLVPVAGNDRSRSQPFDLEVTDSVLGSTNVRLVLQRPLDRENERNYDLKIIARDGGRPRLSGSVDVVITIKDENDNDPIFTNSTYQVAVAENTQVNSNILQVKAHDPDSGHYGTVIYRFTERTRTHDGHMFGIRNTTGEIYTTGVLDRERTSLYTLYIQAGDMGPDSIPADATVIVRVLDLNDNAPQITMNTLSETGTDRAEIREDAEPGTFVAHMAVEDPDEGRNSEFNCTVKDDDVFTLRWSRDEDETPPITSMSRGTSFIYVSKSQEYTIVTRGVLDRENAGRYSLGITCMDRGSTTQIAVKHIQVRDINSYPLRMDSC